MFKWFRHIFHDVTESQPTGEWHLQYDSPWAMFPTRYDEYKCSCGKSDWIPPGDWSDLYWAKKTMDLTIEVADAWVKRGDIDNAIAVLRGKDLPNKSQSDYDTGNVPVRCLEEKPDE